VTSRATASSRYIAKKITEILANGDKETIEEIIRLLLSSDKVFIYGAGRSGLIGKAFAIRLVQLIAMTSRKTSKLAHAANLVVVLDPEPDDETAALAPLGTLFENSALVFLDGIIAHIMEKRKETESKMRGRHAIWV